MPVMLILQLQLVIYILIYAILSKVNTLLRETRMWTNAQRDGCPAEYRWRHVLNVAKFGSRPLLECCPVTLPIIERKT